MTFLSETDGEVIPLTLIVIAPTNKQLLDPALDKDSHLAKRLLLRWGRLHTLVTIREPAEHLLQEGACSKQ